MNKLVIISIVIVAIIVIGTVAYLTTRTSTMMSKKTQVIIYVADAYTEEACCIGKCFSSATGIPVLSPESGGSFQLAREISSPNAQVTVFMPVALSAVNDLGNENPGWAIAFVSDQITIAYTNASISSNSCAQRALYYAKEAISTGNSSDWYEFYYILTSGKVKVGISNPNTDPAGFRAWINLEIAGYLFANNTYYFYDRMLNNHGNVTASNAAELVPELESGAIQFLYIYRSAAVAKGLDYIQLPAKLNLGCYKCSSFYVMFNYTLNTGVVKGSPVYLFITIPKNTNNYNEAIDFVIYVIEHSSILKKFDLCPLQPAILFNSTVVPPQIASLLTEGKLIEGGTL
ncbi:extracellular solute-binding protein family 1 [Acidianus hospitalis W1]|uniref:Extracellular solute-binding protein family 1 n=1 Tax=Acidianus hospitalis (strain W1) TaxID=933801 RepID=F4B3V3_ACIHW|nr:extracellular solute-binding protein [Acidianus hospitalis]AEE94140.1 extracellular solute-binding protein family 1 [Acidianus hospitalis W1]